MVRDYEDATKECHKLHTCYRSLGAQRASQKMLMERRLGTRGLPEKSVYPQLVYFLYPHWAVCNPLPFQVNCTENKGEMLLVNLSFFLFFDGISLLSYYLTQCVLLISGKNGFPTMSFTENQWSAYSRLVVGIFDKVFCLFCRLKVNLPVLTFPTLNYPDPQLWGPEIPGHIVFWNSVFANVQMKL